MIIDIPVAKSILLPEILKDLKIWKKIMSLKPICIFLNNDLKIFNNDLRIGHVSKFVYKARSPRGGDCTYELVAKCVINSNVVKDSFSISPTELNKLEGIIRVSATKSLEDAYFKYKKEKKKEALFSKKSKDKDNECACSEADKLSRLLEATREFVNKLPITQMESLGHINIDTKNKNKPSGYKPSVKTDSDSKKDKIIVMPFSITLKDTIAYGHLLEYTKHYKATFGYVCDKEFKGEIKSISIQDSSIAAIKTRYAPPYSVKAIVNIAITHECKDAIDRLVKDLSPSGLEGICVGSLDSHLLSKSAGALYTIKSYTEKEDKQTINIDMSLNAVMKAEKYSDLINMCSNLPFSVSADNNDQSAKIIYCANTEEEATDLIMEIKGKLQNRFMENRSKQSDFTIYDNYINVEIKSFSSDNTMLKVHDVVLVASKDLGKYFVVAKLQ